MPESGGIVALSADLFGDPFPELLEVADDVDDLGPTVSLDLQIKNNYFHIEISRKHCNREASPVRLQNRFGEI